MPRLSKGAPDTLTSSVPRSRPGGTVTLQSLTRSGHLSMSEEMMPTRQTTDDRSIRFGPGDAGYLAVIDKRFNKRFRAEASRSRAMHATGHPDTDLANPALNTSGVPW